MKMGQKRWKKIALAVLIVFALIGMAATVSILPFVGNYISDMNREVDTTPLVSVPFSTQQEGYQQTMNNVPILHRGLFALTVRLKPKTGTHLSKEEIDNLFYQARHVPFVVKYEVQTAGNPSLLYGKDAVVADFSKEENGDFIFSVPAGFVRKGDRLMIRAENLIQVPEFAKFDAFLEFREKRPDK